MMTGNGVMHNGTTILDEYGHNLDRLKVSDICASLLSFNKLSLFYPPPTTLLTFSCAVISYYLRQT